MTEFDNKVLSLEEINSQFQKSTKSENKSGFRKRRGIVLAIVALLIMSGAFLAFFAVWKNQSKLKTYEADKKSKELEFQYGKLMQDSPYFGIREEIEVTGNSAKIGLINAKGSEQKVKIIITDKNKEKTYYQSSLIEPGAVLDTIVLNEELTKKSKPELTYILYNSKNKKEKEKTLDISFKVKKNEE